MHTRQFLDRNALGNQIVGNSGDNDLWGLGGDDILKGFGGDDILIGGTGDDTMVGGSGDDYYVVDSEGDWVYEYANQGTDTVESSVTYTLGDYVEKLILSGSGNINGYGNGLKPWDEEGSRRSAVVRRSGCSPWR